MSDKPTAKTPAEPAPPDTTTLPAPASDGKKKKLTLDVSDVSEVLERKISP
jgi:hypothetical protein